MKYRLLIVLLPITVACAFLALVFLAAEHESTVALAELASFDQTTMEPKADTFGSLQSVADGSRSLANSELASIFYAVLGVCGVLLAVRAIVSSLRTLKEERMFAQRRSMGLSVDIYQPVSLESERKAAPVPTVEHSDLDPENFSNRFSAANDGRARRRINLDLGIYGLTGKMIFGFAGIFAAFGLLTLALVYFTLSFSPNRYVIRRAKVVAVNVSDGATGYLLKKDSPGLRERLRKHANRPELAYILVEDRAGEIFAHSFAVLPQEVHVASSVGDQAVESERTLRVGDGAVYEVSVPIFEGGAVRVGIWREHVDAEIHETVIPLLKRVAFVLSGGILMAVYLAWRINRPIFKLAAAAQAISRGDLDTPSPNVEDVGEFGELSRALERMRSSVKAAMIRLGR